MSKNTNLSFLTDYITADITNGRIGINNASPTVAFDVSGATKISGALTLTSTISNGTYTYTLPSATGTLALTSALSSYLSLTGGTLTGALSGTSANFSSSVTANGNIIISKDSPHISLYANTGTSGQYNINNSSGTLHWAMYSTIGGGGSQGNWGLYSLGKTGGAGSVIEVTSAGNVGIGNTAPVNQLDLNRSGAPTLFDAGFNATVNGGDIELKYIAAGQSGGRNGAHIFYTGTVVGGSERMRIASTGNVGIGTSSPATFLHVVGANTSNRGQLSIQSNNASNAALVTFYYDTTKVGGIGSTSSDFYGEAVNNYLFYAGGAERMRIGSAGFVASVRTASDADSKTFMNSVNATCGLIPVPAGTTLYLYSRDSSTNYRALLTSSTYFTGQHGNKPVDLDLKNNIENYIGMIVSSAGTYYSVNPITKEVTTGKDAISISEALPEIKLTNIDKDKSVWGVVTNVKNDNYNTDGTVETDNNTEWGDRLGSDVIRINGLGEGAIWVTNINGNIENGDFICSSLIAGYGRKQDDDILRNYTVAKITMDCDFDLNNNNLYKCEEFEFEGKIYKKAFVGCTYHCS
jgi:hypothetical protein